MSAAAFAPIKNGSYWDVALNGKPLNDEKRTLASGFRFWHRYKTKRQTLEHIEKAQEQIKHIERLIGQDASGVYEWDVKEQSEIKKLAKALSDPAFRIKSENEHVKDANLIESWNASINGGGMSEQGKYTCATIRRTMAGRLEAFKLAGLKLREPFSKARRVIGNPLVTETGDNDPTGISCNCGRWIAERDTTEKIEGVMCLDCAARLEAFLLDVAEGR